MSSVTEWAITWAKANGIDLWFEHVTESTNDIAKVEAFKRTAPCSLFLTAHQTKGRGRGSNSWQCSARGGNLLCTWLFPLETSPQHVSGPLLGLALFEAVQQCWPNLEWSLKAPNDLYLGAKKIAGLLAESVQQGQRYALLIGLGFNISSHPEDLDDATHLLSQDGIGADLSAEKWTEFLSALHQQLSLAVQSCTETQLDNARQERLLWALNANPRKAHRVVEVSALGDIVTESGTIPWRSL